MQIEKELTKIGLSGSEIRVYMYLLQEGLSSPSQIAKGTGIARTNTYHVLQSLKEKGLIEQQKKGKRFAYIATDPSATLHVLEKKREAMEAILPDLRALHKKQKNKPTIRFYEGFDQVRTIYEQTLDAEELFATGSTEHLERISPGFIDWYRKALDKKKVIMHDMPAHTAREKTGHELKEALGGLYSMRFLPEKYAEIPTDLLIWDDTVALIALEEPIFGTVLTNKHLADTFRMLFKMAWTSAEK